MNPTTSHTPGSQSALKGLRGKALTFKANPFHVAASDCFTLIDDALIVIRDGIIAAFGPFGDVSPLFPELTDIDHYGDNSLIMPGFIDCHVHYVQSPMIGSAGDTLLDWLDRYTFPTEARFRNGEFAREVARVFFRSILSQGTTTANVFATTFAESVDAFFEESEKYNTRMICGKVLQDRNLPDSLRDSSAEESVLVAEKLLEKWHGRGRQLYAVIPRFAPTSTPLQLKLAGELYRSHLHEGVYMHTHLDESEAEIEWVKELFPNSRNYTEVYNHFGLLGARSVFAHCCIVSPDEWSLLSSHKCGVAHCPSSNLFLGDGEFDISQATAASHRCRVGVGTDVGGGTNFSIPRQLGEAYKVAMLRSQPLSAMQTFYLATRGGAETLHLERTVGSLEAGLEADIAVLDLEPDEFTGWRMQFANDIWEKLFVLQTVAPDCMVKATYVAGRKVFERPDST